MEGAARVSCVYELAAALDDVFDMLCFGWDGTWTDELEVSLVQLLAELEDSGLPLLDNTSVNNNNTNNMLSDASQEVRALARLIALDVPLALSERSALAIGRLHSSLQQLHSLSQLLPLSSALRSAAAAFERAKAHHSPSLWPLLARCNAALDAYGGHCMTALQLPPAHPHVQQLLLFKRLITDAIASSNVAPLAQLRMSLFMSAISQFAADPWRPDPNRLAFWPSLPVDGLLQPQRLQPLVDIYTETLTGEMLLVGGVMGQMRQFAPDVKAALISGLCHAGLSYSASVTGQLAALHGVHRACLFLDRPIVHPKLLARKKDCLRQLRKIAREKPDTRISLRISTDLHAAVEKLRTHHIEGSWVDEGMEKAWACAMEVGGFCIFELWEDDVLCAADFGHVVTSGSFYVATRYFNKDKGHLSPGFLLALLETRVLQKMGYAIWDLGMTDSNPMFQYKSVVAQVISRREFIQEFRKLKTPAQKLIAPKAGVLIESVQESDLLEVTK